VSYTLRFSPEALQQLEELEDYIAEASSPLRAAKYIDAIIDNCDRLTAFPIRGTARDDLRPGLRTIGFRRRVTILFEVGHGTVDIVGIYYGGKQFDAGSNLDVPGADDDQ
jgi:plasmid stabilization system protein ParE